MSEVFRKKLSKLRGWVMALVGPRDWCLGLQSKGAVFFFEKVAGVLSYIVVREITVLEYC
jgi:hypothetical protein